MAGESDQEKAAKTQINQQRGFQKDLASGKYNVANPFSNYESQFGYDEIAQNLNEIFSGTETILNRDTADAVAEGQQDVTSALASKGITGGSALQTARSGVASDINKTKANALTRLGIGKAGAMSDLMKYINSLDFNTKKATVNTDLNNMGNLLSAMSGSMGQSISLLQGLDDTTWIDDVMEGIKLGADVGKTIAGIPGI